MLKTLKEALLKTNKPPLLFHRDRGGEYLSRDSYLVKKHELLSRKKTLGEQISRFSHTHHAWLEPMKNWIIEAADAVNIARRDDLHAKKVLAQKIFGLRVTLFPGYFPHSM